MSQSEILHVDPDSSATANIISQVIVHVHTEGKKQWIHPGWLASLPDVDAQKWVGDATG